MRDLHKKQAASNKTNLRPIDVYLHRLNASHQNPINRLLHYICVPLMVFALLSMAWAIPFPYIKFLGIYNGYFNWASFIIAAAVYYYLKLSPLLSYFALFMFFALSYGVMQLAALEKADGPELSIMSIIILLLSLAGQYAGGKIERNKNSFIDDTRLLVITPLWTIWHLGSKFGLKY